MSVMAYDTGRRYPRHTDLSFPGYYYQGRDIPMDLSHGARADPRGYHLGDLVGGPRGQLEMERNEPTIDNGASRRRIAIACARCRRRKIRCSGDPGNNSGCHNCKAAGLGTGVCQFHRVGSDSVHKVMDNFQIAQSLTGMAHSNRMLPIFTAATSNTMYARTMSSQSYPQLDTKSEYPSTWTIPYSEDTSPVENYGLEQSATYLTNALPMPMPMTNGNMYSSTCRSAQLTNRAFQQTPNVYYDQESSYAAHGLPYGSTDPVRSANPGDYSPLNMISLRMNLPERPHPRHQSGVEGIAPQRQLPFPQPPNPVQTSRRNVLDELQGQRLRSGQAASASSSGSSATFMKPLLPWSSHDNNQISVSTATASGTSASMPPAADGALEFLATTAIDGDTSVAGTSQLELNFSSPTLFDPMTAPAPSTSYSTFREDRAHSQALAHMPRQSSESNLYSFNPDSATKRNSAGDSADDCKLVNGQSYMPLTHRSQQSPVLPKSLHKESFDNRQDPLHRTSMANLSSSF